MNKHSKGTHDYLEDPRNSEVLVYVNGDFVPRQDAKISVFDSGFLLGDGVWEGIRLHNGKLLFLAEHLERLFWGASKIDMDLGKTLGEITNVKNVIYLINVGQLGYTEHTIPLIKKYSEKVDADIIEFGDKEFIDSGYPSPNFLIFDIWKHFENSKYDKMMYIDVDIRILDHSPNIFDEVKNFGMVEDWKAPLWRKEELQKVLEAASYVLCCGGRLAVISFHSMEDRIVKRFFQGKDRIESKVEFEYMKDRFFKPTAEEISINPRSRSAILRVAEKVC